MTGVKMTNTGKRPVDGLDKLLDRIVNRELVRSGEILPFLCLEKRSERCRVNFGLAEAFSKVGNKLQARIFMDRAWILSGFSAEILPLYLKIHSELDDLDPIREAYKRLGIIKAGEKKIGDAIRYFNLWHYTYAAYRRQENYKFDFDITESIEKLAEPYRLDPGLETDSLKGRKIRLAYLVYGITQINSVLVKINLLFAKYHDKSRFDITFFLPDQEEAVSNASQARGNIKNIKETGCNVVVSPYSLSVEKRLIGVAGQIYNYNPDILITSALLADFEHYFIASLRPAPVIIGLVQGPPPQYVSSMLDWTISWSKHPLIDSPCDCSLVKLGLDLPDRGLIKSCTRHDFSIPDSSLILMSAGRHVKFQSTDFWKSIFEIMSLHPDVYYMVVGVSKEQVSFLEELLVPDLTERLRLLGWRDDCVNILSLADIVIDTFPSGGGHVLIDSMALGIPFVSFENNYMGIFDQNNWSVADEFADIPELIVDRNDFKQFKSVVSRLIKDKGYRTRMGELCKEQVNLSNGCPEKGVRRCEDIYIKTLKNKLDESRLSFTLSRSKRQTVRGGMADRRQLNPGYGYSLRTLFPAMWERILLMCKRIYRLLFKAFKAES